MITVLLGLIMFLPRFLSLSSSQKKNIKKLKKKRPKGKFVWGRGGGQMNRLSERNERKTVSFWQRPQKSSQKTLIFLRNGCLGGGGSDSEKEK